MTCKPSKGCTWQIAGAGHNRFISCAVCYRVLGLDELLNAYVKVHGGRRYP